MNVLKMGSQLRGPAIVSGTENEIQQFFQGRCVRGSAAQYGFEQANRFLRQAVAGKQVDVG